MGNYKYVPVPVRYHIVLNGTVNLFRYSSDNFEPVGNDLSITTNKYTHSISSHEELSIYE